jgi:autotransporter-associated beta strand protein
MQRNQSHPFSLTLAQMKSKNRFIRLQAIAASSICFFSAQAEAQLLYWDSNGSGTNGFGNTTGTWGIDNFWNTDSSGGAGTFSTTTSSSNTVNFGTVTQNYGTTNTAISVGIAAGGVTVNSIVYGANQSSAITLGTAGNTLTLAGTTPTITVNNTRFHQVILSPINGTQGLTKTGAGTLVLRGTNVYTGGTTVNAGTLSFGTIDSKSSGTHSFSAGTTLGLGLGAVGRFTDTDILNAFAGSFIGNLSGISLDTTTNIALDTTSGALTFSANIGPSTRGLVKIANGSNLTLTGANQYSGRTVVGGGSALIVNSLGNIADSSSNVGTNSTIDMLDASRIDIATTSSSDKHFNLLGNATIFQSDLVTFTHTGTISTATAGTKTLTFATNGMALTDVKDFQGVISNGSGTIAVTKSNSGNIWISGNNSYTGATSVSGGVLIIGHANALGSTVAGTTVSNGASLALRGGIITAAEALTFTPGTSGTSMLRNLTGNNTWSGTITSNTTTTTHVSRVASDADKLTLAGTVSITGSVHQFVLQGAGNIDITGQITGIGIVSSATNGTGVRKLANDTNNYTGQTRINGGTLEFTSIANVGAAASSLGAPVLADSVINLGFDTTDATLRYVGTATGGHTSDRVISLNYIGTTTANYTLQASGTGPLVLTSGVTAANGSKTLTLSGTSTAANSIGVIANGGSGSISVTKSGTGTWILTGTNSYGGNTLVNEGVLMATTSGALPGNATSGRVSFGGGTIGVRVGGSGWTTAQVDTLLTNATKTSGALGIDTTNGNLTQWAAFNTTNLGANLGLTKLAANTLTLDQANNYTGATTVSAGTLQIGNAGTTGALTGTSSVTVSSGANITINRSNGFSQASDLNNRAISGGGSFTQAGSGTTTLSLVNTYTGATSVSQGTLEIASGGSTHASSAVSVTGTSSLIVNGIIHGSVTTATGTTLSGSGVIKGTTTISGFHNPGNSPGTQTFESGLSYTATSVLNWELIDNTVAGRGSNYDAVNVIGGVLSINSNASINLAFSGAVSFANAFWSSNQSWLVVDLSGSATASDSNLFTIGSITGGGYNPALGTFGITRATGSNSANSVYLTWTAIPETSSSLLGALGALVLLSRRRSA